MVIQNSLSASSAAASEGRIVVDESDYKGDEDKLPFEIKEVVRIRANEKFSKFYECFDEIGEGKFGKVYRCREKATGLELAAKRIKIKRDADRAQVEKEVAIMTQMRHPRIAQIYDAFSTPENDIILVMEVVRGGELFDRVVDENYILTETAVVMIICQLCEAVAYIHSKNIVHLDIKPENIMCVSQTGNRIKLIDFGLAQYYDGSSNLLFMAGTPEFVAPEVIKFEPIDFHTDMWSIGVITYILLSGISPFLGETLGETYCAVEKGEWEFDEEAFEGISDEAKDFISKLLVYDQKKRMLPEECLNHPWIVGCRAKAGNDLILSQPNTGKPLSKEGLKSYLKNKRFRKATWALVFLIRFKKHGSLNWKVLNTANKEQELKDMTTALRLPTHSANACSASFESDFKIADECRPSTSTAHPSIPTAHQALAERAPKRKKLLPSEEAAKEKLHKGEKQKLEFEAKVEKKNEEKRIEKECLRERQTNAAAPLAQPRTDTGKNKFEKSSDTLVSEDRRTEINKKTSSVAAILSMFSAKEEAAKRQERRPSRAVRTLRDVERPPKPNAPTIENSTKIESPKLDKQQKELADGSSTTKEEQIFRNLTDVACRKPKDQATLKGKTENTTCTAKGTAAESISSVKVNEPSDKKGSKEPLNVKNGSQEELFNEISTSSRPKIKLTCEGESTTVIRRKTSVKNEVRSSEANTTKAVNGQLIEENRKWATNETKIGLVESKSTSRSDANRLKSTVEKDSRIAQFRSVALQGEMQRKVSAAHAKGETTVELKKTEKSLKGELHLGTKKFADGDVIAERSATASRQIEDVLLGKKVISLNKDSDQTSVDKSLSAQRKTCATSKTVIDGVETVDETTERSFVSATSGKPPSGNSEKRHRTSKKSTSSKGKSTEENKLLAQKPITCGDAEVIRKRDSQCDKKSTLQLQKMNEDIIGPDNDDPRSCDAYCNKERFAAESKSSSHAITAKDGDDGKLQSCSKAAEKKGSTTSQTRTERSQSMSSSCSSESSQNSKLKGKVKGKKQEPCETEAVPHTGKRKNILKEGYGSDGEGVKRATKKKFNVNEPDVKEFVSLENVIEDGKPKAEEKFMKRKVTFAKDQLKDELPMPPPTTVPGFQLSRVRSESNIAARARSSANASFVFQRQIIDDQIIEKTGTPKSRRVLSVDAGKTKRDEMEVNSFEWLRMKLESRINEEQKGTSWKGRSELKIPFAQVDNAHRALDKWKSMEKKSQKPDFKG